VLESDKKSEEGRKDQRVRSWRIKRLIDLLWRSRRPIMKEIRRGTLKKKKKKTIKKKRYSLPPSPPPLSRFGHRSVIIHERISTSGTRRVQCITVGPYRNIHARLNNIQSVVAFNGAACYKRVRLYTLR